MGTKHTAGPWEVISNLNGFHIKESKLKVNGQWQFADRIAENIQNESDAAIIASAPKMLEALEYVVKYHRDNDSGEGELYGLDLVTTCIDAIQLAKGGNE